MTNPDPAMLLAALRARGWVSPPNTRGEHRVQCFRPEKHANGDAHPSCQVHLEHGARCFVCGFKARPGGLARLLGISTNGTRGQARSGHITRTIYDYRDEAGDVEFQVVREDGGPRGKVIFQRRPLPDHPGAYALGLAAGWYTRRGGGLWKRIEHNGGSDDPPAYVSGAVYLAAARPLLYGLDRLFAAKDSRPWPGDDAFKGRWLLIVEGEKCAAAALTRAIPATTNAMGAGKWTAEHTKQLVACGVKRIVLSRDLDPIGSRHMAEVLDACMATGKFEVFWLDPRDLAMTTEGADLADWIGAGKPAEVLLGKITTAPRVRARGDLPPEVRADLGDSEPELWPEGVPPPFPPDSPYCLRDGRLALWVSGRESKDPERSALANFDAWVQEEHLRDDGVERAMFFQVQGRLATGDSLPALTVPAEKFRDLTWLPAGWGARPTIKVARNAREHVSVAIQSRNPKPPRRTVFTSLGWRRMGDLDVFIHAQGALGEAAIAVDVPEALRRYVLPGTPEDARYAMSVSLDLLRTGAVPTVMFPLWATMFRAPLCHVQPADYSLALEGKSSAGKSTVAAAGLCHFGPFDRLSLPANWSSTANDLELLAFAAKDVPLVIDELTPDVKDWENKAARIFRAQGNLSGRSRRRADLTHRPALPPRGIIVSTGEARPPGPSLVARQFIVPVRRGDVSLDALAALDLARLPHAMVAYLLWLQPQLAAVAPAMRATFVGARSRALAKGPAEQHGRTAEAVATLWLGLTSGLQCAEDLGALDAVERQRLEALGLEAFEALAYTHTAAIQSESPARRYLRAVASLLASRQVAVLGQDDEDADGHALPPTLKLIGWVSKTREFVFLIPEATREAVAEHCRKTGEPFLVRDLTLRDDLYTSKLLDVDPKHQTRTRTIKVGGHTRRVLALKLPLVEQFLGDAETLAAPTPYTPVTEVTGRRN